MTSIVLLITKVTVILVMAEVACRLSNHWPAKQRLRIYSWTLLILALAPVWGLGFSPRYSVVFRALASGSGAPPEHATPVPWVQIAWALGAGLILMRLLAGATYLIRMRKRPFQSQLEIDNVPIYLAHVPTPLVWGWFRPVILLPLEADSWTKERIDFAVRHEAEHIRNHDHRSWLLVTLIQAAYWFHPLVWRLTSRLRFEKELRCDEQVLAFGANPHEYAAMLIDVSRDFRFLSVANCGMKGPTSHLKGRIMNILAYGSGSAPLKMRRTSFISITALITACLLIPVKGYDLAPGQSSTQSDAEPGGVYKIGGDVAAPVLLKKVEPKYTKEATDKKIHGATVLSIVIDKSGVPGDIQVKRSLDAGLDEKAIEALRQWRFKPAMKKGEPVVVQATVEVNFKLK